MRSYDPAGKARFLCFILLFSLKVQAQTEPNDVDLPEPRLPSSIRVDAGLDSEGGQSYFFDVDYGLKSGYRVFAGVGATRQENEDVVLETRNYLLGFASDPLDPFNLALEYDYWGKENDLIVQGVRGTMELNYRGWVITARPRLRAIRVYFTGPIAKVRPNLDINSTGYDVRLGYQGFETWQLGVSYGRNAYSWDVTRLDEDPRLGLILSPVALDLAYTFEKSRAGGDLTYFFSKSSIGLTAYRSVSAVDRADTDVGILSLTYDLGRHWTVYLNGGAQTDSVSERTIGFGSTGLGYRW